MNILHIASLDNNKSSGVSVVVPEHVINQGKIEQVGLLNCSGIQLNFSDSNLNIYYKKQCPKGSLFNLPTPFNKPDIVIFHGIYYYYFLQVAQYLRKEQIPYVIVPHGSLTSFAQRKKYLKKFLGNLLFFKSFIKNSIAIQYLTSNERLMSSGFKKNYIVCGNGMYVRDIVRQTKKNKLVFQLTFIGRLDPFHKGLDLLIQACNKISYEMREFNIFLSIFGPDHQGGKRYIEDMIKELQIEDIISIGDALYEKDKLHQLKETDVFVLTSRFEGQPLAAMEALAMGIPVILTPGTNIAEEVEKHNCGWKAEFTVESVAERILEAYKSRDNLEEYSDHAIKLISDNYSWTTIASKNIVELKKVMSNFS